jgi:phosphomannomutase
VLLRPSGTEPKVRVMVEGSSREEVQLLCAELAAEVERILT